jgi:2-dehydro-3-deoxyphosphogluconate aldolase/(4S)-4-hydroxy-2-oxoglutarate aldolase
MTVLSAMIARGVISVFYHPDVEVCQKVIQACANGGAKCIEFANRGEFAAQALFEAARHFATADPSVFIGVGSVVDAPTAGVFANGAKFVVAPLTTGD